MKLQTLVIVIILGLTSCRNEQKAPVVFEPIVPTDATESYDSHTSSRDIWQKPDAVLSMLGNLDTMVVADIGAGTGFFALRLVKKARKVIAIDIDPDAIRQLDSIDIKLPAIYSERLETRLVQSDDPYLRPSEVDAVLLANTYTYLSNRRDYLKIVTKGLRPKGRVMIVDFKENRFEIGPRSNQRVSSTQVAQDFEASGYKVVLKDTTTLEYQYIVIGAKE
jgi:ubiquinone/menaquinone biosynthesis C-methylase UbiE